MCRHDASREMDKTPCSKIAGPGAGQVQSCDRPAGEMGAGVGADGTVFASSLATAGKQARLDAPETTRLSPSTEERMSPLKVSAQFAAFTWFIDQRENAGKPAEEAHCFARANWERFLPVANEGWGRLLLRLAGGKRKNKRRQPVPSELVEAATARCTAAPDTAQDTATFLGYTWAGRDS